MGDRPAVGGRPAVCGTPSTVGTESRFVMFRNLVRTLGVNPATILAITFTNKAAGEMRERLDALLDAAEAQSVTVKTFHAFGAYLLRTYAAEIGLPPEFVILDDAARRELFALAVPELNGAAVDAAFAAMAAAKNQLAPLAPDFSEID